MQCSNIYYALTIIYVLWSVGKAANAKIICKYSNMATAIAFLSVRYSIKRN